MSLLVLLDRTRQSDLNIKECLAHPTVYDMYITGWSERQLLQDVNRYELCLSLSTIKIFDHIDENV